MKIKFKNILYILIINIICILNVESATLEIDGKNTINEGSTETININLKTDGEEITRVDFDLAYNSDILKIKIDNEKNPYGYAPVLNNDTVSVLKVNNNLTDGTIITLNISALPNEDTEEIISIQNVKINETATEISASKKVTIKKAITTTTRALNTSAKLTNITINNATYKPAFSANIKDYKIYVNKDTIKQITIRPTYEQSGVTMQVACTLGCTSDNVTPNKLNLAMGKNEATFTFTSEDQKTTETYNFIIYRGETTDGSNFLSDLSIEGVTLNEKFDKLSLDYTASIPYDTETVNVIATPEDENADVSIKGNENLKVGENVVTITVTSAETTEKKIYNITLTREEFTPSEESTTNTVPKIEKETRNNTLLIIIIAGVSTLIIGIAAYLIFIFPKHKAKKNNKKEKIEVLDAEIPDKKSLIDEDKEPTSVEDALADLMKTKEIEKAKK